MAQVKPERLDLPRRYEKDRVKTRRGLRANDAAQRSRLTRNSNQRTAHSTNKHRPAAGREATPGRPCSCRRQTSR